MSLSISVVYPKRITIPTGAKIEIMGYFEEQSQMLAHRILDGERGLTYQLHPDDIPKIKNYAGAILWNSPLVATVISSIQYGETTHLSVFPEDQTVYDYNRSLEPMRSAAVPAFWKLVAQRQNWEHLVTPFGMSLFNIQRDKPQVYDASATVRILFDLFARKRCFQVTRAVDYLWGSLQKLCQAERHLQRMKIIDDLRLHLFSISRSEGREFLLRETEEEAGLIVEAVASVVYSALDLLGHVINEVYQLGIASNVANFMNTVTEKRREGEVEAITGRCLQTMFADDSLTGYLLKQRNGWIRELEAWRHYIVHHGVLDTGNFVDGGVVIMPPENEPELLQNMRFDTDATAMISGWATSLRETLLEAYRLIGKKAEDMALLSDEELPIGKFPEDQFQIDRNRPMKEILEFFRLWKAIDEPQKTQFMYTRLHPSWQKEWPFQEFNTFVEAHSLFRYSFTEGISSGTNLPTRTALMLDFGDVKVKWNVALEPHRNGTGPVKYGLVRTIGSTLPAFQTRLKMTNLKRKQSGRETGHRDAIFVGTIRNTGDVILKDINLHVLTGSVCGATTLVGSLEPSEERTFEVIWKDGCISLGGTNSFPIPMVYSTPNLVVRAIYTLSTPEGSFWAEDVTI